MCVLVGPGNGPDFFSLNKFGLYYKLLYVCIEIDGYEKVFIGSRDNRSCSNV